MIAAFGDSLVQGYGLSQQEGFVPQLQGWLDSRDAKVRVLNAGVSGDTTAGGLARIGWTLTPEVDGLIVVLGGNDMLRGVDPAASRANIDGILTAARDADVDVLLVGMKATGNFGPDYKAEFDAIYPDLVATYGTVHAGNFFGGFGDAATDPAAAQPLMQADGIHPNARGVRMIVEGLGPDVLDLVDRIRE